MAPGLCLCVGSTLNNEYVMGANTLDIPPGGVRLVLCSSSERYSQETDRDKTAIANLDKAAERFQAFLAKRRWQGRAPCCATYNKALRLFFFSVLSHPKAVYGFVSLLLPEVPNEISPFRGKWFKSDFFFFYLSFFKCNIKISTLDVPM